MFLFITIIINIIIVIVIVIVIIIIILHGSSMAQAWLICPSSIIILHHPSSIIIHHHLSSPSLPGPEFVTPIRLSASPSDLSLR